MGRKIIAVIVGALVDITITVVLGLAFGIALAIYLSAHGVSPHDLMTRGNEYARTPASLLASTGLGSFGTLIGGFVTGWIARRQRILCGFIMGCASFASAIPFMGKEPLWYNLLGVPLTLIMATGGAWAAEALLGRSSSPPAPPPQ